MRRFRLSEIPFSGVSHNPEIRKQVLIPNGVVPQLTTFAKSVFEPGQVCTPHIHPDMFEIYLVEAGSGELVLDGVPHPLQPGDCLIVEPGEEHSVRNPGKEALHLTYFGIEIPNTPGPAE